MSVLYRVVDCRGELVDGDETFGFYRSVEEAQDACRGFDSMWPDDGPYHYEATHMKAYYTLAYEDEYSAILNTGLHPGQDGRIHLYETVEDAKKANLPWKATKMNPAAYREAQKALRDGDSKKYWLGLGAAFQHFSHALLIQVVKHENVVPVCTRSEDWEPGCGVKFFHFAYAGSLAPGELELLRIPIGDPE